MSMISLEIRATRPEVIVTSLRIKEYRDKYDKSSEMGVTNLEMLVRHESGDDCDKYGDDVTSLKMLWQI